MKLSDISLRHEARRINKSGYNKKVTAPTSSLKKICGKERGPASIIKRQEEMGVTGYNPINALRFRTTSRDLIEIGLKLAYGMLVSHC
jgi:hypothetical protein